MKLRLLPLLTLLIAVSLLVQGAPLPAAARTEPAPAEPAAPTAFSCDAVTEIPKTECEALVALYNSTNGPGWRNRTGWLQINTPCSWFGVACSQGHVQDLKFSSNQLSGAIPPQLSNLINLQTLYLSRNQLTGAIPPQLGNLAELSWLHLDNNQLTGAIPPQLGSLANLQELSLSGNQLTGNIPPQLGNLAELWGLYIFSNQLTGAIPPQLGNLINLQTLALSWNQLTGAIPPQLGNFAKLSWLYLDHNQLTGAIPAGLGSLPNLQRLSLDSNKLTGAMPRELGGLVGLTTLSLANNALEGEIPAELVNLTALNKGQDDYTDLGFNKLSTSNPSVIAFFNTKDPDWAQTQTVPPVSLTATSKPVNSVELAWVSVPYTGDGGYYEVGYSTTPGDPYSIHGRTSNKAASNYTVTNLLPGRTYYFAVRTYTPAHGDQQNNLLSGWSQEVSATTLSPSVRHIEITQATQDEGNNVPLIAGKLTMARVYVDCGEGCAKMAGVTGILRAYGGAGELPESPVESINDSVEARHEPWPGQRGDLSRTLNFTLPPEWTTGAITLTAEVSGAIGEERVVFQPAHSLNVIYVPIRYKGQEPDSERIRLAVSYAYEVYPAARINYVRGDTLAWDACLVQSLLCPFGDWNSQRLLDELTNRYRLVNAYVFGWLPAGTLQGGNSDPTWLGGAGKAAMGDDDPALGGRGFVHEIGHLLGRQHTNTTANLSDANCVKNSNPRPILGYGGSEDEWRAFVDVKSDWVREDVVSGPEPPPFPNSRIQEWGLDGWHFGWLLSSSSALAAPSDNYDYMSYCYGSVWTSPWTYEHIFQKKLRAPVASSADRSSESQPYLMASGVVFADTTAMLDPMWTITTTTAPENPPVGSAYCLEAYDAGGSVLTSRCFDLSFLDYETGRPTGVDGFNLMLPYSSGIRRLVLKKGITELASRTASNHAPQITVLSPNRGETWAASGTYTITWNADDLDGDLLTFRVLYSPDGDNWVPVGTAITTTQLAVNAAELAGGTAARVRVMATDGVNTSSDESDAPFTVGRKGPSAFILAPEGDVRFMPGTPLWLQGYSYDLEDGTLAGAALRWHSDRDGDLGTGSQALVTLSPGRHVLTLGATDKDGNQAATSINVYAGGKTYLPLVLRGQ